MRKVRPDSKLQTLPEKQQEALFEALSTMNLVDAVAWCKSSLKIETSKSALSRFRDWYESNKWVDDCRKMADEFRSNLKARPGFREDGLAVMDAAQVYFETMVMKKRDPKLFIAMRKLKNAEKFLNLERDKFQFDAAKACLKQLPALKAISQDKNLDEDAKLKAVREKLFGDLPE